MSSIDVYHKCDFDGQQLNCSIRSLQVCCIQIDHWQNCDFWLMDVDNWSVNCNLGDIDIHSGIDVHLHFHWLHLTVHTQVKRCFFRCDHTGCRNFGFLSIQYLRNLSLLVQQYSLVISNSHTLVSSYFTDLLFIQILIIQPCSCSGSQWVIGVMTRQSSSLTQFCDHFAQCAHANWLTTVPDMHSRFCKWSQVQILAALWIMWGSFHKILFIDAHNAPLWLFLVLKSSHYFGLIMQWFQSALMIFALMFSVLQIMHICVIVHLDFKVSKTAYLQCLVFTAGTQCKVQSNQVQQCVDKLFRYIISKQSSLPHVILFIQFWTVPLVR